MAQTINDLLKTWEKNWKAVVQLDKDAKKQNTILGRYLKERCGDGYAFYKIVKVNKLNVAIQVITGIGDDWILPYWGEKISISRTYAEHNIQERDYLDEIFSKSHKEQLI